LRSEYTVLEEMRYDPHVESDRQILEAEGDGCQRFAVPTSDLIRIDGGWDYLFASRRPDLSSREPRVDLSGPTVTLYRAITFEGVVVEAGTVRAADDSPFLLRTGDGKFEEIFA
jgi:hypothetical protein